VSRKLVSFDWAMKKILRQKDNFDILEGFLSELFKFDVKIVEILESEANQESESDKFNRVDLLAKDNKNELILIEVQYDSQQDYFHRMLYGASKLICEYMEKGEDYAKVKKVYSVNIVYFALAKGKDYLYYGKTIFYGQNEPDEVFELSNLQQKQFGVDSVHQIFPEYFVIRVNKFKDKTKNRIDEWIYFLKNEMIRDDFKAKGLDKAKETLDLMKLEDKDRIAYNRKLENRGLKKSLLKSAKIEGIEEGKKEGRKEGEKKAKIEIAKSLLDVLDIKTIAIKTGLSVEEIENSI
jgi:predicted transposase/invertase (TIGR01784 family)